MKTLPANAVAYQRTAEFTHSTVPSGLLRSHNTKEGVWAKIVVLEGALTDRILEPSVEEIELAPDRFGVIEPTVKHEVVPRSGVRFYVEFHRVEPPGTWRLLAHGLHGDAVVDWAVRAMELGLDTRELRLVAGFSKPASLSDVEAPFFLALKQLGFSIPLSETTIRRAYAREIAEAVIDGSMSPLDAANEMERHVLGPLKHPDDLRPWCFLQGSLHPETYTELSDAERDRLILAEARRILGASDPKKEET